MRILCCSMGSSMTAAFRLQEKLSKWKFHFYLSDREEFQKSDQTGLNFFAEWELVQNTVMEQNNHANNGILNRAYLMDRRLSGGASNGLFGQLSPKYSMERTFEILSSANQKIRRKVDEIKPDACILFSVTTFGDYLIYTYCKEKSIPTFIVRGTKIENFVNLFNDLSVLGESGYSSEEHSSIVRDFLMKSRQEKIKYEGSLNYKFNLLKAIRSIVISCLIDIRRMSTEADRHHKASNFKRVLFKEFIFPLRHALRRHEYETKLPKDYIFFPLHAEPEIALQLNNIKAIRQYDLAMMLADQLPFGRYLVLKEHPRNFGQKPSKLYKKLVNHPRIKLVFDSHSTSELIQKSAWVFSLSGSCALESLIASKPILTYTETYYSIPGMCEAVASLDYQSMADRISRFEHDESKLISLLLQLLSGSRRVNLYTELYRKADRAGATNDIDSMDNLVSLIREKLSYD